VVTINFREALIDGTAVQSSEPGIPVRFPTGNVIPGFIQALQLMQAPAKARFYIPASLAYADRGAGTKVLPYSALVIDVELLKVEHAP
jgi:FKBP-type peptidyl-prolyl cis-trans isomerase